MMNAQMPVIGLSATEPAPRAGAPVPASYLTFLLAGEAYAIGILAIKEIIEYAGVTAVPMMPACVRGVINLRGAAVPVMDLQARFGRTPAGITKRTCIVIVEIGTPHGRQVIGVIVDSVSEVVDIAATDIEPAPAFGTRVQSGYISGMGKVRGRFVILLDIDTVLALQDAEDDARDGAAAKPSGEPVALAA
jgi:purine-binding chemotaxis protein CheW